MLSTAHRINDGVETAAKSKTGRNVKRWVLPDGREDVLYSATHINHPSAVWCRQSAENYRWLHNLLCELVKEYNFRYGKTHKCQEIGLVDKLSLLPSNFPSVGFTEPTPAMPDECRVPGNSVASYRSYYIMNKQHLASWSGKINSRPVPEWFHA